MPIWAQGEDDHSGAPRDLISQISNTPEPFGQRLGGGLSMDAREKYRRRDRSRVQFVFGAIFGSGLF
jgi:hypothetical protein